MIEIWDSIVHKLQKTEKNVTGQKISEGFQQDRKLSYLKTGTNLFLKYNVFKIHVFKIDRGGGVIADSMEIYRFQLTVYFTIHKNSKCQKRIAVGVI